MFIIKYRKIFIAISLVFIAASLALVAIFGLRLGIDFTGGSALTFSYETERPDIEVIKSELAQAGFTDALVQPTGEKDVQIKTKELSEEDKVSINSALTIDGTSVGSQTSFTSIGPSVGKELKNKAIISIILVLVSIICFVAYAFRKVSEPVSSWKYGLAVIIALLHDVIIPTGVFALLGHLIGAEVDTLFIVSLLTILALSLADTIVVFDRIRENLGNDEKHERNFEDVVGESLSQTFVRSLNTSVVVLVMVLSLAIFGPESTRLFGMMLALGLFFGIYSSLFLAAPLLVSMEKLQKKKE